VSFRLEAGKCLVVVGPSGSGKSTLALALAGLVPHEIPGEWRGRLTVDGSAARIDGRAGLLFQDPDRQLVMDRAEDDVAFGLENRGWPRPMMVERVASALADVGLAGFERRRATHLSGGEQQRLALAGVLAPRPGLLILDEPTANLDPAGVAALGRLLAGLKSAGAMSLVLIEHHADIAWPLADTVLALGPDGRPIDVGPPADVASRSGDDLRAAGIWLPNEPFADGQGAAEPASSRSGRPLVTADRVTFAFDRGEPVVSEVSLSIGAGERVALTGPNGSGKSTLSRLLIGLLRPDAGTIRLAGDDPATLPAEALARRAGYVFQDPERQFLAATVADEVRLGLRPDELERVEGLMDALRLPLEHFGARSPYRLSGGEQRRLSIASVLARRPELIVLDEPTFGQDRHGHAALLGILADRIEQGTAVLAATHDERFVAAFAERRVEMDAGTIR
jgi:energy-coupling factor transport system ATP-binding protein